MDQDATKEFNMTVEIQNDNSASGQVVTIRYNREEKLNALDSVGIQELTNAFVSIADNSNVRVVIFTGSGSKSFIGGADVNELSRLDENTARNFITSLHELFVSIRHSPVPVIARINGYCLGAGMELAAACDLRIASENAIFGMPEVKVGIPSVIEAALLPRLVGWGRSNYLVFTGENIDAKIAYEWGFLESVTCQDQLDIETDRFIEAIVKAGPLAVREQKRLVRQWEVLPLDAAIEAGIDSLAKSYRTEEPRSSMQSFFDRKK
ncbi:MAG: enoyl-CoA hydratase [Chloroflexi bacterium]|nr:enoyl-CoA hydratase [Chloroflexota bacterium]|tara:strand:+ start:3687 stop:4481 length:795 start_codon:yes stop_codon:yes gene_type:complete